MLQLITCNGKKSSHSSKMCTYKLQLHFHRIQFVNMFVSTYVKIRIWNNQRITITCSHLAPIKILLLFHACKYKNKANGDESVLAFEIYLWSKVICFVLSQWYLLNHIAFHAMLLVSLESSWWVGVHQLGLRLFGATMWKLLINEPFFQWKLNKIKTKNCIGIWRHYWLKTLGGLN